MSEPVQGFDKAVLVLYRDGREVGTLTFEADGFGMGRPLVRLEEAQLGMEDLQWRARFAPLVERPGFRVEAAVMTLRLAQDDPATPPR
jgi:hypothetical protein